MASSVNGLQRGVYVTAKEDKTEIDGNADGNIDTLFIMWLSDCAHRRDE